MRAALALSALLSLPSIAQTPAPSKSFVLADIHSSPFTADPFMHGNSIMGDRYFLTQATMLDLIATAYGVDAANVHGGPTWLERDRFDLRAMVPPHTTRDDIQPMLRSLLADRFHLVVKTGTAPLPTYILSAAPGKPKINESQEPGDGSCMPQPPPPTPTPGAPNYIILNCKHLTMAALADTLHDFAGGYIDQPVVD